MSLLTTCKTMNELLSQITTDLQKAEKGNKAASQRVRTGTVKLEKISKMYRKESVVSEKKNKGHKKPVKLATGIAKAKASHQDKARPSTKQKGTGQSPNKTAVKLSTKVKTHSKSQPAPMASAQKRATAKLPNKKSN